MASEEKRRSKVVMPIGDDLSEENFKTFQSQLRAWLEEVAPKVIERQLRLEKDPDTFFTKILNDYKELDSGFTICVDKLDEKIKVDEAKLERLKGEPLQELKEELVDLHIQNSKVFKYCVLKEKENMQYVKMKSLETFMIYKISHVDFKGVF